MEELVSSFLHLLDETETFVRKSAARFNGDDLGDFLRDYRHKRVNPLYRRIERINSPRYVLSMVGLTNVGKSTLAHALLGHAVAPRRMGPATAIPVEYEFSHEWRLTTYFREAQQVSKRVFETADELSKVLESKVLNKPRENSVAEEGIELIVVRGPMELLKDGIVFADTPGFGAAQTEADGLSHEQALVEYLKEHVHEVMFCLSGSNSMVSRTEEKFFRDIQELCSTVIVTKWDSDPDVRAREIERYRDKFADLFPYCGFMFVEAKWAIEGRERSSIEALQALIRERSTREKRIEIIRSQLVCAWDDLQELGKEPLRKSKASAMPWHKAALPRFLSEARNQDLKLTPAL